MILVDSCVWIDLLRGKITPSVCVLQKIREEQTTEICINSIVYFEVLRGITSDLVRRKTQRIFDSLERREYLHAGFDRLISLSLDAEKHGVFVKKLGDWLILKTILDHSLTLLTSDGDFKRLSQVIPFLLEPL